MIQRMVVDIIRSIANMALLFCSASLLSLLLLSLLLASCIMILSRPKNRYRMRY